MKSIDASTNIGESTDLNSAILRDANNNSIFGGQFRPRLALNNHTSIELAEQMNLTQRSDPVQMRSPFV